MQGKQGNLGRGTGPGRRVKQSGTKMTAVVSSVPALNRGDRRGKISLGEQSLWLGDGKWFRGREEVAFN